MFSDPLPDGMFWYYSNDASAFEHGQPGGMHVDYAGSALPDSQDHRRRSTTAAAADRKGPIIPNVNLLGESPAIPHATDPLQRRRAQNRVSQRAFRERKERYVKSLERQLEELRQKHQKLLQSYSQKAEEAIRLNTRVAELGSEAVCLQSSRNLSSGFAMWDKWAMDPDPDMYCSEFE